MYGYIRPLKPELRIREGERYQSAYCGLCHALAHRFGLLARFCVSYDMVLPILLLPEPPATCRKRCPIHPFRRRCVVGESTALERIAAMTVILAWHKLDDAVRDQRGVRRLAARLGRRVLCRAYRTAEQSEPAFAESAAQHLQALTALEAAPGDGSAVLDQAADCFAAVTAELALLVPEEARIRHELFYHVGRFVYLLDAADDLQDDFRHGRFNPLIPRFSLTTPVLSEADREALEETMELSLAAAAAAFELLPTRPDSPICANILYLGLPDAMRAVLAAPAEDGH